MAERKQVYELTTADLERCGVWEFALDEEDVEGQDEATVRPMAGVDIVDPGDGLCAVRARFVLADGTRLVGYVTPVPEDTSVGMVQPVIVADGGQVGFWSGITRPGKDEIAAAYASLDRNASEVFPVRYESDVPLVGGAVAGVLNGFCWTKKNKVFEER